MGRLDKDTRDYGIDFLRIFSMIMIIIAHIVGPGGMQAVAGTYLPNHRPAWLLMAFGPCCLNVYAQISGYVGVKSKPRISSILHIWLQVVFYTVGCLIVASFIWPEAVSVSPGSIWGALRPVTQRTYWFFTSYFALMFLMPALNHIVLTLPKKDLLVLLAACFVLFSLIPTITMRDVFNTADGYSMLWLAIMYLFGGALRRFEVPQKVDSWWKILLVFALFLACGFANYFNWVIFLHKKQFDASYALYTLPAVTNVLIPIALISVFASKTLPKFANAIIRVIAPYTFGVYLLHVNPHIYFNFFDGRFAPLVELSPKRQIVTIGAIAVSIFLLCILVDAIRALLFKLLHVRDFCRWVEKKITSIRFPLREKSTES